MIKNLSTKSQMLIFLSVFTLFCNNVKVFNVDIFLPLVAVIFVCYFSYYFVKKREYDAVTFLTIFYLVILIATKLYFASPLY